MLNILKDFVVVVVLGFYVPATAKVIRRRDLGLKYHPKDWRSPGSNSRPMVYKASNLTTTPRRLLFLKTATHHTYIISYHYTYINKVKRVEI